MSSKTTTTEREWTTPEGHPPVIVREVVSEVSTEQEKFAAEAAAARANERKLLAEAEKAELELAKAKRLEATELATDRHHHVYVFDEPVGSSSVKKCISQLTEWMRNNPGCDIELIIDSPGGSVIDGMHLWDFLSIVKARGHRLTTTALGYAASMGGILLQAGDVRVLGRQSYVLIHEVSFGAGGKIGEVEDEVAFVKKIQERVLDIFAERSNLSKSKLRTMWRRKDVWLDSDECLKYKLVDEVR